MYFDRINVVRYYHRNVFIHQDSTENTYSREKRVLGGRLECVLEGVRGCNGRVYYWLSRLPVMYPRFPKNRGFLEGLLEEVLEGVLVGILEGAWRVYIRGSTRACIREGNRITCDVPSLSKEQGFLPLGFGNQGGSAHKRVVIVPVITMTIIVGVSVHVSDNICIILGV